MTDGLTLRWHDEERLTPEQRAALSGPGAPFERTMEEVLGRRASRCSCSGPAACVEVLRNSADAVRRPALPRVSRRDGHVRGDARAWPARSRRVLADEYGVGKGDRVAFASANSLDVRARRSSAVVSLGAIIVGLNGWWTGPELAYGMELTTPKVLFGDEARLDAAGRGRDHGHPMMPRRCGELSEQLPDVAIDEDDPFMILFTLGHDRPPEGGHAHPSQHGAHGLGHGLRPGRHACC